MARRGHTFNTQYEQVHKTEQGYKFINLATGRRIGFHDAEEKSQSVITTTARWVTRMFKLVGDHEHSQYDIDDIDRVLFRLETLVGHWRAELDKRNVRKTKEERIKQLRDVKGREPEEAAVYLAKADELERGLDA